MHLFKAHKKRRDPADKLKCSKYGLGLHCWIISLILSLETRIFIVLLTGFGQCSLSKESLKAITWIRTRDLRFGMINQPEVLSEKCIEYLLLL